jgi:hypothetical protein
MARVYFHNYNHPVFKADPTKANIKGKVVEESIYYWWFKTIYRSAKYKKACAKNGDGMKNLYNDFGNIFTFADTPEGFQKWWTKKNKENGQDLGAVLFGEPSLSYDVEQLTPKDLIGLGNGWDTKQQTIMSIPLQLPKKEILRRIKLELDKVPDRKQDTDKKWKKVSTALYKVSEGYFYNYREALSLEAAFKFKGPLWNIKTTLETYDIWKANPKKGHPLHKSQWQIVYEHKKINEVKTEPENTEKKDAIKQIMREDDVTCQKAAQIYKEQVEDLDIDAVREKRTSDYSNITSTALDGEKNSSGAEFKRRQKKWEQLITGVEAGKFPMGLRKHGK